MYTPLLTSVRAHSPARGTPVLTAPSPQLGGTRLGLPDLEMAGEVLLSPPLASHASSITPGDLSAVSV